jgi:hypothetical protein
VFAVAGTWMDTSMRKMQEHVLPSLVKAPSRTPASFGAFR